MIDKDILKLVFKEKTKNYFAEGDVVTLTHYSSEEFVDNGDDKPLNLNEMDENAIMSVYYTCYINQKEWNDMVGVENGDKDEFEGEERCCEDYKIIYISDYLSKERDLKIDKICN